MSSRSPARFLRVLLLTAGAAFGISATGVIAADKTPAPSAQEKAELEKFASYSGPVNVLESNPKGGIQKFLDKNDGKTVYLDTTIVRYIPIDPAFIDDPNIRASTDRFDNPVFTRCWPDQKADYEGLLNFGDKGFPLPADEKDIEAGCASRIRFELPNIKDSASFPALWGDNRIQVFVNGFYSIAKTRLEDGKSLYTLTQQRDVPFETRLAFDTHKTRKHPEVHLSSKKD